MEVAFYSISEVAAHLNISQKTVRRHIAAKTLDSVRIGNVYRIPKIAIDHFINNQANNQARVGYNLFGELELLPAKNPKIRNNNPDDVNWVSIEDEWQKPTKSPLTFVDLFCGAGGLSKGLELAGLEGICGLDWFKEGGMTYRRNFDHPLVEGDIKSEEIKTLFYNTVKEGLKGRPLTLIAGGFPCQGFSMAGNRIVDDPRNSLYKEMLEIVTTLKPLYVVCENVTGLRTMLSGKVEQKILDDFEAAGYKMNVTTLRAANYCVPQKRDRVIFIGNRIGTTNFHPQTLLTPEHYITTAMAIGDLINQPENKAFNHVPTKHKADMEERLMAVPEGKSLYKGYSDAWKKCPWNEASCTIKENHGGVNIHPKLPRVLTAREMARLQSFPDDFIFEGPKNKQLVQLGNAVPPLLGKAIGLAIKKSYNKKLL
ncbi:MAG: DNA cytosine methyltransferase [Alistipes sp.]